MIDSRKGQGSFLSGDIPSIIMIVISITFFISSLYMAIEQFDSSKDVIYTEAALVDAASAFLKENAMIRPADLENEAGFWAQRLNKLKNTYGVQVYVELESLALDFGCMGCANDCCKCTPGDGLCLYGSPPPVNSDVLSKRFPVAIRSGLTELEVYPALVRISIYK